MTNSKQLTSAVALLASIAVLDKFVFVELEPGFESMVLIEPHGSPIEAETTRANESIEAMKGAKDFWIDQHSVSSADFAKFVESTGYELHQAASFKPQIIANQVEAISLAVSIEEARAQIGNTNWKKTSGDYPMSHTVSGQDDLKVNFKDAQTYCNWLGKVLPTAEQFEHIAKEDHDKNASGPIEFRCVRNI